MTLGPGASLRVKYAGQRGYLQYQVVIEGMIIQGDGVVAGGTSETPVPPGKIQVKCWWPDGRETKELELAAGEEKEIVLGGGR